MTKESDQTMHSCDISANGMRRAAAVVLEMNAPLRRQRGSRVS